MIPAPLVILSEFIAARRRLRRLDTPEKVRAHQTRLLDAQLSRIAAGMPFYKAFKGKPLAEWPVIDKTVVNDNFAALNVAGITAGEARRAAEAALNGMPGGGRVKGFIAGMSTGTSGNRGLYVVSGRERYRWLGTVLAKTVPDFPWVSHRIAVVMPGGAQLYSAAGESRRLQFRFFDVRDGIAPHRAALETFGPDIVVAPPKVLRLMAEAGFEITPCALFSGGEVLDPLDGRAVRDRYGIGVRSIYQATEGFLGVACEHGTMHLNEDVMLFEREPVAGGEGAFNPVITDLVRSSQAMVRYRMNDILVPGEPCTCGSPLTSIQRIEGRMDDVLLLPARSGVGSVSVLPSTIRDAILDAVPALTDFRAIQVAANAIEVRVPEGTGEPAASVLRNAVMAACRRSGAESVDIAVAPGIETPLDRKVRRVERRWRGAP